MRDITARRQTGTPRISSAAAKFTEFKKNYVFYCQGLVGVKCEIHNRVKPAPTSIPASSRPIIAATFHIAAFSLASLVSVCFASNSPGSEIEAVTNLGVVEISGCTSRQ